MPIVQSSGRSEKRHRLLSQCRAAFVGFMQVLGLIFLFSHLAYGQDRFLLDNVRVIIGDGIVLESAALLVEGSRIAAVGPRPEIEPDSDVEVIDLSGKTVMPAMIDSHAHLGYEGHRNWGVENYSRENLIDHLQRYAYYGFSAVFSAGSDPYALAYEVQQAQLSGEFAGARVLVAAGMGPPGQGPNDRFLNHAIALEQKTGQRILYGVASVEQAIESVREIAAKNIPVIKIWVDDRGGSQQKLSPQLYRVIAAEAASNGIEVYAHQQFAQDMPDLLDAGIDGFLHGRIGTSLDGKIAQQLNAKGAFIVPNLGLGELRREAIGADQFLRESLPESVAARLGESGQRLLNPNREETREMELRTSFGYLLDAGVEIVLGTDAGAIPDHFFGYTGHRELEIFVRLGMTPMQAIIAATSKPAQNLGIDDLGLLRPGYKAAFVVLDENPLEDIRNTRSISSVFLNGKIVNRKSLAAGFVE